MTWTIIVCNTNVTLDLIILRKCAFWDTIFFAIAKFK